MGIDRTWQALPESCEILELAKSSAYALESLDHISIYFDDAFTARWQMDDETKIFCRAIKALKRLHPGIEKRNFYTRLYDAAHFLLSEARRNGDSYDYDDLGTQIICGAHELTDTAIPFRYSNRAETLEMAVYMATITEKQLREYYDPVLMEAQAVYKFSGKRADEKEWQAIHHSFDGIRKVYLQAAEHEEGVLATQTY